MFNGIENKVVEIFKILNDKELKKETRTYNQFEKIAYAVKSNKKVAIRTDSDDCYSHNGKEHKIFELIFDFVYEFIQFKEEIVYPGGKSFTRTVILYPEHIVSIEIIEANDDK